MSDIFDDFETRLSKLETERARLDTITAERDRARLERDRWKEDHAKLEATVAAGEVVALEREACAKVADAWLEAVGHIGPLQTVGLRQAAQGIAAAIRARGGG